MRTDVTVRRTSALAALAAVFLLSACATGLPASVTSPIASEAAPPSASAPPSENPVAEEPEPTPVEETPAPDSAPPAAWTNEELIGACKVEWNNSGATDWSSFSSDALVEPSGDSYHVVFRSTSTDEQRECKISGTPASPEVAIH